MSATTVGGLIDRIFRQYLEPPDAQAASTRLNGAIDDTVTTFALHLFDIPDDENLVRLGSIIEVGTELMRLTDYVVDTHVATVIREVEGTTRAAHDDGVKVKLSPPYARQDVLNSVGENITQLYPSLWSVRTAIVSNVGVDTYVMPDDLAVEIIEATFDTAVATVATEARIVDYNRLTGGRAVITNIKAAGQLWVRYRRRFGVVTSEDDILDELGLDSSWQQAVSAGVAADMLAGRDIPASNVEWVGSTLQAENITVGTRAQLSVGLARYRELLVGRLANEMQAEDSSRPVMRMNDPFAVV